MNKTIIVGKRKVNYTNKNGKQVVGTTVYYQEENPIENGVGVGIVCGSSYCNEDDFPYDKIILNKPCVLSKNDYKNINYIIYA